MDSQYKTIHPMKYLQDHLAQNIRPDGREFLSFRPMRINVASITHADSSAILKIGNTAVVCGIKAELAAPGVEAPDHGYIIPNVELSPLCSPKFRPGPPSEQAQILSKMIQHILHSSEAIDTRELCICKGRLAWVLYCDLVCINYDGSVIDACTGALTAALRALSLPEVKYNMESGVTDVHPTNRTSMPIKVLPVSTTFAVFDNQLLIADPTEDEESLSLGRLSIVMIDKKICYIHKPGGIPVSQELLQTALKKSKARAELVRKLIDIALLPAKDALECVEKK